MLKINTTIETPHGLSVSGTIWRWIGLSIDAAVGQAQIVLCCYPSVEIANLVGTSNAKPPLMEERYGIGGFEFLTIVGNDSEGSNLSERVSNAIYRHLKAVVAKFVDADVV